MKLEIHKTLVLSTSHISRDDSYILTDRCEEPWIIKPNIIVEKYEYGWRVYVKDIFEDEPNLHTYFSRGFIKSMRLGEYNNCRWVEFDESGPVLIGMPKYDW